MIDDEIGKLMVVNKLFVNIVSLSGISVILQNLYIKMYYVLGLCYVIHKIVSIISLLNNNCE